MKQFIKDLFTPAPPSQPSPLANEDHSPQKELFVDDTEPLKKAMTDVSPKVCPVTKMMETNYERLGYIDGHNHHDAEYMQKKLREIKRKFTNAMNLKLDGLKAEAHQLKMQEIGCSDVSPMLKEKLAQSIAYNLDKQERLVFERELSAMGEGMVMKCIHEYQTGFTQGVSDYLTENELLNNHKLFE